MSSILCSCAASSIGSSEEKIVLPRFRIDHRPTHRFPHGTNAALPKPRVILARKPVMLGCRDLIDPPVVDVVAGRAFKTAQEKAAKHYRFTSARSEPTRSVPEDTAAR